MKRTRAAFTLIELLVVIAIVGVLIGLIAGLLPGIKLKAAQAKSSNNMRQIGNGFQVYVSDNDFRLPGRVRDGDKWPIEIYNYLGDKTAYADPADKENFIQTRKDPLSNASNNTSYIMNGYNDIPGMYEGEAPPPKASNLDMPSQTILLALKDASGNFFMDFAEGNQNSGVLNKTVYNNGANYLFADGSVRYISKKDYDDNGYGDRLWLVHKDSPIP